MQRFVICLLVIGLWTGCGEKAENKAVSETVVEKQASRTPAINVDAQGRALHGYDVVSYFKANEAMAGKAEFQHTWQGASWWFVDAENRDAFAKAPEKYAPACGGYCTFGIVLKKKLDGDPQVWLRESDNLYVFLNKEVRTKFLQDREGNLSRVQNNWPSIKDKKPEDLE